MKIAVKKIVTEVTESNIMNVETIYDISIDTNIRELINKIYGDRENRPTWQYESEIIIKLMVE